MKKLICILAGAALLGACEQKTETVTPAAAPADKKTENNTTVVNPPAKTETGTKTTNNITTTAPAANTEKKTETATTTSSSPNP
jgi:uncharacterized lipoprotein YajG